MKRLTLPSASERRSFTGNRWSLSLVIQELPLAETAYAMIRNSKGWSADSAFYGNSRKGQQVCEFRAVPTLPIKKPKDVDLVFFATGARV